MTTEERLENLERKIKDMEAVIRTKTLWVMDDQGHERIWLTVDKNGPVLGMANERGKTQAVMGVVKEGPALIMNDENGRNRVSMRVDKKEPGIRMKDENGKPVWKAHQEIALVNKKSRAGTATTKERINK